MKPSPPPPKSVQSFDLDRMRASRNSFATSELSVDKLKAIAASRMDPRHAYLDALLDRK
jgi:hypothetical protein